MRTPQEEMEELNQMLERQIKRRDKELLIAGMASKKTTNQISKTRQLIKIFESKTTKP